MEVPIFLGSLRLSHWKLLHGLCDSSSVELCRNSDGVIFILRKKMNANGGKCLSRPSVTWLKTSSHSVRVNKKVTSPRDRTQFMNKQWETKR